MTHPEIRRGAEAIAAQVVGLFDRSFGASEGVDEGAAIAGLVTRLIDEGADVFTAWHNGRIAGAICFTPLTYDDPHHVALLSPVAVDPAVQGRGIGQALIRAALDRLAAEGVAIVVTYGDIAFYGKVGFAPVTTDVLPAPQPLSQPGGWIAQSLAGAPITPLPAPARAVPAFDDPDLW